MIKPLQLFSFFLVTTIIPPPVLSAPADSSRISQLKQSIRSLDIIRNQAIETGIRETTALAEKGDYNAYINYLQGRILFDCKQLVELDQQAVQDLPCPGWSQAMSSLKRPEMHTPSEKVANLDQLLSQSLGQFDEILLQEQEKIASRIPSRHETGSDEDKQTSPDTNVSGSSGELPSDAVSSPPPESEHKTENTSGTDSSTTDPGQTDTPSGHSGEPGPRHGESTGAKQPSSTKGQEEFNPKDDDIIARQLREAAVKETDQVLKEKLWEEYRNYRKQIK